jgi:hypothetical protein
VRQTEVEHAGNSSLAPTTDSSIRSRSGTASTSIGGRKRNEPLELEDLSRLLTYVDNGFSYLEKFMVTSPDVWKRYGI